MRPLQTLWASVARQHRDAWRFRQLMQSSVRLLPLMGNLVLHQRVLRTFRLPKFDGLVKAYPRVLFKYLGRQYLANQLSTAERGEALVHHYRFMHETFSASFVRSVVFDDAEVWNDGRGHAMTLGYSDPVDQEGELSLVFRRRGTAIFTLSFSFVPGRLCSLEDAHVLLITRIQGTKGCFEDIRMATRLMEDVSPANVLLACAAGIGLAADVHQIIGVAGRQQSSNHGEPTLTAHLIGAYDEFWLSLGANRLAPAWFHLPVPLPEKPLGQIKRNHRARTKVKRRLKKHITGAVHQRLQAHRVAEPVPSTG